LRTSRINSSFSPRLPFRRLGPLTQGALMLSVSGELKLKSSGIIEEDLSEVDPIFQIPA
jgi:hypothetical protein